MEERHKNWSREMWKSFILKSPSNKKQLNLLHWKAQWKWTLFSFHIVEKYCAYLTKILWNFFSESIFYVEICLYPRIFLSRIVTINARLRIFQYKVLNNALYLNKHLYIFKLSDPKLCCFCSHEDETVIHLLANCSKSKTLWNSLKEFFKGIINLPSLTPQSGIFGFLQTDQELFLILNYFLLLFKYYLYVSRCSKTISFAALKTNIKKTYILEKNLSRYDEKKKRFFLKKWGKVSIYF